MSYRSILFATTLCLAIASIGQASAHSGGGLGGGFNAGAFNASHSSTMISHGAGPSRGPAFKAGNGVTPMPQPTPKGIGTVGSLHPVKRPIPGPIVFTAAQTTPNGVGTVGSVNTTKTPIPGPIVSPPTPMPTGSTTAAPTPATTPQMMPPKSKNVGSIEVVAGGDVAVEPVNPEAGCYWTMRRVHMPWGWVWRRMFICG